MVGYSMGRYTTKELAEMKLPGFPGTPQGWDLRVKSEEWEFVEARGRGRGGVRREYSPPASVQALIDKQLAAELASGTADPKNQSAVTSKSNGSGREPAKEENYLTEGKDMALMAMAGHAIDMAIADLDLAGDMSMEERGRVAGALHDTFFDRRESGVNARMMADFLIAAWRNSRRASA
jgi:hypothetical protein